jgi:hypothetical protein
MSDTEEEDAMAEVVPLDSPARHAANPMRTEDWDHVERVIDAHATLTRKKYVAGRDEHGGNCWEKPGMLQHALDEAADLPVYLHTAKEQIHELAADLRAGHLSCVDAAEALERLLKP